jgi:putative addiction module component (TIGR02574 family)
MTATIQNLFAAAMTLDADSRRDLSEQLWDTVQPQDESVFSEATWQEIDRRVAASDAGQVEHVAGDVALAQVRAEHGLPSAG